MQTANAFPPSPGPNFLNLEYPYMDDVSQKHPEMSQHNLVPQLSFGQVLHPTMGVSMHNAGNYPLGSRHQQFLYGYGPSHLVYDLDISPNKLMSNQSMEHAEQIIPGHAIHQMFTRTGSRPAPNCGSRSLLGSERKPTASGEDLRDGKQLKLINKSSAPGSYTDSPPPSARVSSACVSNHTTPEREIRSLFDKEKKKFKLVCESTPGQLTCSANNYKQMFQAVSPQPNEHRSKASRSSQQHSVSAFQPF